MENDLIIKTIKNHEERLKKLEDMFKTSKDDIKLGTKREVYDIEEDKLTLTEHIGKDTKEKIQNISLLVLLGYKNKFNKIKVLGSELRRNVAINKIPIENFATYLNKLIPQSILRIGKSKSSKTFYKLTPFGEAKAKELFQKI